jgi:hypothetical protein
MTTGRVIAAAMVVGTMAGLAVVTMTTAGLAVATMTRTVTRVEGMGTGTVVEMERITERGMGTAEEAGGMGTMTTTTTRGTKTTTECKTLHC